MPSSPTETRSVALRYRVQEALARHVIDPGTIANAYIRYQDIKDAWSGHETIELALLPSSLTHAEIDLVRTKLLRFLSILVYIDAHEFLNDFRRQAFDNTGALRFYDSDLPVKDNAVPDVGSFMLKQRFLNEQYLFIPEVIHESASVKQIDDRRRLPFESISRRVFAGAYGEVDKVGISPNYLKTLDGGTYPDVKFVACKRFHSQRNSVHNDSTRELDNLQVLKESITSHSNIRLHLAIILHQREHRILLPWADHLDLDIFLNEGHDFLGREIYKFPVRFHRIQPGTMINDVCTQMHHIAHALEWLHRGITTQGSHQNRIRFAHMDLKPNNILIDNDDGPSTVGKWVLTDFGISAFKEDDDEDSSNFVSVRDYYQNLTINTSPRRDPGAYQPPEVEHENHAFERRNTAKEGSAGRRGDIWSFACIFSEVLAFSLGQADLVKEFRTVRKGRRRNDYFYEAADDETLRPDNFSPSYRVRPSIVEWLQALPGRYTFPKRAIDCCVETILRILIVDGASRPKAYELLRMLNHVANHTNQARAPGGFPANCPLEQNIPPPPPVVPEPEIPAGPIGIPSLIRSDTAGMEPLSPGQSFWEPGVAAHFSPELRMPRDTQGPFQNRSDSLVSPGNYIPLQSQLETGLGIINPERSPSIPESAQSPLLDRPISREPRRDLHGILIDWDKPRKVCAAVERVPPEIKKVVSFHLCSSGDQIAYLMEPKRSQFEIHIYSLLLAEQKIFNSIGWLPYGNPISLAKGTSWEHVVSAGNYVVAWGNYGNSKQVFISNGSGSRTLIGSDYKWLATLLTVAVSKHGSLAFVCTKSLLYTTADGEIVNTTGSINREPIRVKSEHHSFTHAAFNDDGSLLYAWEYGRPDDRLSVWRIVDERLMLPVDSEGSYPSSQQGNGKAMLIPYNTYHGCIMRAQGNAFFPAQIRSTQRGSNDKLEKKIIELSDTVAACVYGDHSLLVVEKGFRHTRIWERRIVGGGMHIIEKETERVVELKGRAHDQVQMKVVAVPGTDDLTIVLCMLDGRVIMIPVAA